MKRLIWMVLVMALASCTQGNVLTLADGDCFDDPDGEETEVTDVPIVDCADPHDNEVYQILDVEGDSYPGQNAVGSQADAECLAGFEPFVGATYEDSELDYGWLTPTQESWDSGDREIVCFVYRVDLAKLTGTMEGSGV